MEKNELNNALDNEFDIKISSVLLAHECIYPVGVYNDAYEKGRFFCGFVLAVSGSAKYTFPKKCVVLNEGDLIFLCDNCKYIIETHGDIPFHHYTVNFITEDFNPRGIFTEDFCVLKTENKKLYRNMLSQISALWSKKKWGYRLLAKAYLYEILHSFFLETTKSGKNRDILSKILPAKNYLDENYSETVETEYLAQLCGISRTHFRRLFKTLYLKSPLEYQTDLKILRAKDLLLLKTYTVGEVAEMCGFSDGNYFSRIFKEKVGISPLKFKAMY